MHARHSHIGWIVMVLAVYAALILSACGGSTGGGTSTSTPGPRSGSELFVQNCGKCHTLAAAGTTGTRGPDLDTVFAGRGAAMIEPVVRRQIDTGGGGMPADIVSGKEAQRVAAYVASVIK